MIDRKEMHDSVHSRHIYDNGCALCDVVETLHALISGKAVVPEWCTVESCIHDEIHALYMAYGICPKDYCRGCRKQKSEGDFSIRGGKCDDCLADEAADNNYSYHAGEF